MNARRLNELLQGQTNIARKVFEAVPIREAWPVHQIRMAMSEVTRSTIDAHVLRGCLRALKDCALVTEPARGVFRRVEIKEEKEIEPMKHSPAIATPAAAPASPAAASPLATLAPFAERARALGREWTKFADDLEAAALGLEEQRETDGKHVQALRQLRDIFKEIA